jgi:site-specific recombinase XerD
MCSILEVGIPRPVARHRDKKRYTPSQAAPAFATRLNAKGVGMRTIQKLMGHRHIGTTALYCDVSEETVHNAVELV